MICDTSGIISAHIADQPYNEETLEAMNRADSLILSPISLSEIDQVVSVRNGSWASRRIFEELVEPEYELASFDESDLALALGVMTSNEDLNIGLVDASLVVLAKRYKTNEILTLDQRHFRAIRGLDGRHFKLLPFDLD